jgi:hypothetical protein
MKTTDHVFAFAKEKYELVLQKVYQQNKMLNTYMMTLNTFDNKFETLLELLERKGIITYSEFEELFDSNTGWRKMSADEDVVAGNVVWVDYKMTNEEVREKVPEGYIGEKDMPIRMGAKAILFEDALYNHKVGDTLQFEYEDQNEKKTYHFEITITKAKAKIGEGKYGNNEQYDDGANGEIVNGSESELPAQI